MDEANPINFDAPANQGILRYLSDPARIARSVSIVRDRPSCSPDEVEQPYLTLGAHPDLLSRFWDELTVKLPVDCRWIVYGMPVLVCPPSGVIFGFCGGTHTYALRLPPPERQAAIEAGAKRVHEYSVVPTRGIAPKRLDLDEIGPEWVFGGWFRGEEEWCLAAYRFAEAAR